MDASKEIISAVSFLTKPTMNKNDTFLCYCKIPSPFLLSRLMGHIKTQLVYYTFQDHNICFGNERTQIEKENSHYTISSPLARQMHDVLSIKLGTSFLVGKKKKKLFTHWFLKVHRSSTRKLSSPLLPQLVYHQHYLSKVA